VCRYGTGVFMFFEPGIGRPFTQTEMLAAEDSIAVRIKRTEEEEVHTFGPRPTPDEEARIFGFPRRTLLKDPSNTEDK